MKTKRFLSLILTLAILSTFTTAYAAPLTPTGETVYENRTEITEGLFYDNTILTNSKDKRVETFSLEAAAGGPVYPIVAFGDVINDFMTIDDVIANAESRGLNVLGGINADFFYSSRSLPLGAVIAGGRLLTNNSDENMLGFDENGAFFSDHPNIQITLENLGGGETVDELTGAQHSNAGKTVEVHQLNRVRMAGSGIFLYDSGYDSVSTGTSLDGWGVIFRILDGTMTASGEMSLLVEQVIPSGKDYPLDDEHMVLTAQAASAFSTAYQNFSVGDRVTLKTTCSDERLAGAEYATGCGDLLVHEGKITEKSDWDQALIAVHPRTALGIKPDGSVIAYAVDGRRSSYSNGALLENIAADLIARGCNEVINLDGGGSTVMSVRLPGQEHSAIVNKPSGAVRKCATYILFVTDEKPTGKATMLHLGEDGAFILAGASMPLTLTATDSAGLPAAVPDDITVSCLYGQIEDGIYTAGAAGVDTITMTSSSGISGKASIHVTDTLDTLTLTDEATGEAPAVTGLEEDAVISLSLAATRLLRPVTVDRTQAVFTLTEGMGTVTEGVLTLTKGNVYKGELTVSLGGCQTAVPVSFKKPDNFSDTVGHWAESSIKLLYDNDAVNGVGDNRFDPDGIITRASFVTMIWNFLDKPAADSPCTFPDVAPGTWYYDQIAWSQSVGLIGGKGDGTFDPDGNLTREQGFTILYRLLHDLLRRELPAPDETALEAFSDADDVALYARDATESLVTYGLIYGSGGMIMPQHEMSRAEVATLLARAFF